MKNLKAKLNKQGGFTLIEMLIVVAIIAILIAVSIPLVNSSLERARESTDAANERSFKAVLLISFANGKYELTGGTTTDFETFNVDEIFAYDAVNGVIVPSDDADDVKVYGKSTKVSVVDDVDRKGQILFGAIDSKTGQAVMRWAAAGSPPASVTALKSDAAVRTLISPKMVEEG